MVAAVWDVVIEPSSLQHFERLDAHADGDRPLDWGTLWATGSFDGEPTGAGGACAAGAVLVQPAESDDRPWLPAMVRLAEDLQRSTDAISTALAAHVDRSFKPHVTRYERLGIPEKENDFTGAAAYLSELTGVSKTAARTRMKAGQNFLPRPLPGALADITDTATPHYRHTGRAYTSGAVSAEGTQRIIRALQEVITYGRRCKVPQEKVKLAVASGDEFLAGQVGIGTPEEFRDLCDTWVERAKALLDQDGVPPEEAGKPPEHEMPQNQLQDIAPEHMVQISLSLKGSTSLPRSLSGIGDALLDGEHDFGPGLRQIRITLNTGEPTTSKN